GSADGQAGRRPHSDGTVPRAYGDTAAGRLVVVPRLFGRDTSTRRGLAELLREETVGGVLLIIAAVAALLLANTTDVYATIRDFAIGPAALQLHLTIGEWDIGRVLC